MNDGGTQDLAAVRVILTGYFNGLHEGDVEKLAPLFDPGARLQAPGLRRSRDEWLHVVANRISPAQRGDAFAYRILAIEIAGDQAVAKVDCPLLDHRYTDFLSLLRENGAWRIVNKMYAERAD